MAYSRWGKSRWFTFGGSPEHIPKLEQIFCIQDNSGSIFHFTYNQMKNDIESCLKTISAEVDSTQVEIEELKGYMSDFIKDCDENN